MGVSLLLLASLAVAEPSRAEIFAGVSGGGDSAYQFVTAQAALLRTVEAGFVLRATVSQLTYRYPDAKTVGPLIRVSGPGVSVGPGFVYHADDLALGIAVGFGARYLTWDTGPVEGSPEGVASPTLAELRKAPRAGHGRFSGAVADVTLSSDASWRPGRRASLYGQYSFNAVDRYLWARLGSTLSVLPLLRPGEAVSVWAGAEVVSSGTLISPRRTLEVGPVVEVPFRSGRTVLSVRAARRFQDRGEGLAPLGETVGAGLYFSY